MERASARDPWPEADALFEAALELPHADREEFLRRMCRGRPELKREVARLLDACAAAEACFEGIAGAIGATLERAISDRIGPAAEKESVEPAGQRIDRYRIVRLLARGGMGTVYLAERADGAFERRVALKLLRRGLDTEDILARFRAERQILADLEHQHIARLIDGGSTDDGRPYLVMEYVQGVPITDYCERHELEVEARLRLLADVCRAVHHAHVHGIVHRDLKPANILVDDAGRVKLLDFGIARLLAGEAGGLHTRTGMRLMTPEYASPEQVRGEGAGVASDVYQLGMLLYELLAGARAYQVTGRSVTEIERLVCRQPITPPSGRVPRDRRQRLRGDLDGITLKALSKAPDGRYGSVLELAGDLEGHLEGRPVAARADARGYILRHHARRHRVALLAVPVVAAAILAFVVWPGSGSPAAPVVPGTVAVVPFRVSGADASLGYLREGMVDLLSSKLTGEGGPQAIAPVTVLAAWREEGGSPVRDLPERRALAAASRVGAEALVAGEVVGTPSAMILGATLMSVPDGKVEARVTVEGPADSLLALMDELTSRLLILGSGVDVRPLGAAASTSLPAIRAYLEGRVHFRAARYDEAYDRFGHAFELDSTLALAAVDMYRSAWFSQRNAGDQLLQVAWRGRERLDEDALMLVEATLGQDYPQPFTQVDRLAARRRLVERNPEQVDHVYMYADRMHHWHAQIELPDGRRRAAAQFRRALDLDSTFAPTYQHLIPLLYSLGMNEEATRAAQAYLRREPTGSIRSFVSWRMAAAHADTAGLANIRAAMRSLSDGELLQIYRTAVQDAVEVGDAENAMAVLRARGLAPSTQRYVLREDFAFQLLRGRPAAAVAAATRLRESQVDEVDFPRLEARNALVLTALYGDGDTTAARVALDALVTDFEQGVSASGDAGIPDLCTIAQWRAWHSDGRGIRRAVARLRATDNTGVLKDTGPLCAVLVEAIEAVLRNRSDAGIRVARLDSIVATGPSALYAESVVPATLATALLHEALGDPAGALAAVRRRVYDLDTANLLLATSLRLEGRFAALAGDTASAARAYRHYLVLRDDPEPALRAQADSVRAALASLESG